MLVWLHLSWLRLDPWAYTFGGVGLDVLVDPAQTIPLHLAISAFVSGSQGDVVGV